MRLHRITLRDVKGVAERTVELPDSGVVVVEGPNEVGKSTIIEAFDKLLDPRLKATSQSREVLRLKPVNRDVGPFVEAEFTVGGHRVRFAKQWLRRPSTTLEILSPVPEQLTGEAAQARLDRLVGESLDRTLWDALRLTQSGDGTVAPLVSSTVLGQALDAAGGSQLHAEEGERVLDRAEREFRTYFTATGRPTGDYTQARRDHTQAQHEVAEAHRRLQEASTLLERQDVARQRVTELEGRLATAGAALETAQREHDSVAEVVAAHEQARARLGEARERSRTAAQGVKQRRDQAGAVAALTEQLTQAERARAEDEQQAAVLGEALRVAEEALGGADEAVEAADAVCDRARTAADHLADRLEADRLRSLVTAVHRLVDELDQAHAAEPAHLVSAATLRAVRALDQQVAVLRAKHEGASARVRVEALGVPAEIDGGSGEGRTSVAAHSSATVVLGSEVVVTVPGAVRVVVEPEADSRVRAQALETAQAELASALSGTGADGLGALEEAAEATEANRSRVRELTRGLRSALSGRAPAELHEALAGQLPADLVADVERLRTQVDRQEGERPADEPAPPDEATARAVARAAATDLQKAREARKAAMVDLQERRRAVATLRARLDRVAGVIEADRERRNALSAALDRARAQTPDSVLEEQAQRRAGAFAEAETAELSARRALEEADADGAQRRLADVSAGADRLRADLQVAWATLHTLGGQVEMAQSEGRQELYDLAVRGLDEAEGVLASLDRRARAARHLWRTLQEHRSAAHRAYALPFTRALEDLGRRVYGDSFSVSVDDELSLRDRSLDGATVPFDELSGGAKEQLGILARLAVARLVDPTQGVPVVIDDALGYSDPERLEQMGEVLGASAEGADVQVILLTCTPERYASIPHAQTVRLTA
ncbi:AAA family ATPase [Ornithinimicrobium sp. LYQ121]|uniref:AAA family ATPase n=1 Tax=Ornithinimicrobium sp. LYQ121 TaxID=3378801 RepID=UPI0038540D51